VEDLLVQRIRFPGEKAQGNEIGVPEETLPTKQTTKIDPSKLSVKILLK
jgi:hypothetical protein